MANKVENYIAKYKSFVTKNPHLASEIEVGIKWLSYIAAGRVSHSSIITELIHSASNLLTFVNDSILRKAAGLPANDVAVEKLQTFLAVIEYSEVFAEVATQRMGGSRGKWLTIVFIQFIKTVIRILLILKYDQGLQHSPPIPSLNRRRDLPQGSGENKESSVVLNGTSSNVNTVFTLKRSGRVVRTLDAALPLVSRSWKLPKSAENHKPTYGSPSKLSKESFIGEMFHLCRPIIHLTSLGAFGETSWKPWLIALGIDITSLHLIKTKKDYSRAEQFEINRRALSLIVYVLRSPFYDQYSKLRIVSILKIISDNLIGSGLILRPLLEYLPEWQQIYFYTWSS